MITRMFSRFLNRIIVSNIISIKSEMGANNDEYKINYGRDRISH